MIEILTNPQVRHDFVLLFDVTDGNPNGDPDAGNLPRVDPETMQGLVTDVCIKRKVRDYVSVRKQNYAGFNIYVQHRGVLYNEQAKAYQALEIEDTKNASRAQEAKQWMCRNFYDVRAFGAVMSTTEFNCGQVRGPVQLTFARSVDPVVPMDLSITRVAVTRTGEDKETEMGRKSLVPYGLYRSYGFFNPFLAAETGFASEDLALFWEALQNMWDMDRSAARGLMACRGLVVFTHDSALGNAPAHLLFELYRVERRAGVVTPRSFEDYVVSLASDKLPPGVKATVLVPSN
ncbi:MAG: type I-C CRISPR-associated protein Cas7/Csd2 [Thermoleophilia bacterium]|nr:type I-C CRISPR-associated protein Cas7/Csd2 [Thermoleophilia bacterium]